MEYLKIRNQLRDYWFLTRINNWLDDESMTESAFANIDINMMITLEAWSNLGGGKNEK